MNLIDSRNEELYSIKDDPDPSGSGLMGKSAGYNLSATADAHPLVRWRDRVLQMDVFVRTEGIVIHTYCPKCLNMLQISSHKKRIRFVPEANPDCTRPGGRLDVERFRCAWGDRGCDWQVVIVDNVARSVA